MKSFKKLLCLALVAIMAMSIVACGKSDKKGDLDGVYTYDALKELLNMETTLEFKGDKVTLTDINNGEVTTTVSGTYKVDGDKVTITIQGANQTGTISSDKNTIIIDDGGEGTVYHK